MSNNPNRNIERLETLAQWLEQGAVHVDPESGETFGFDMDHWFDEAEDSYDPAFDETRPDWVPTDCGTVMCLGGATEQFFGSKVSVPTSLADREESSAYILGLSEESGQALFYPWDVSDIDPYEPISPSDAARVVRHLIETGEVNWDIILEDA